MQEPVDVAGPQAVADQFGFLLRESLGDVILGVRILQNVDRLLFPLQRFDDLFQVRFLVGKVRADDILSRRAN